MNESTRQEHIQPASFPYHKYRNTYQIMGGVALLFFGMWLGSVVVGQDNAIFEGNSLAYWTNVITEILGVAVTVFLVNQIQIARDKDKLRKRLLRQAKSPSQAIATEAIAQLREEGWLMGEDGILQGQYLRGANLQGADLTGANLQGTKLYEANLSEAILEMADLRDANLQGANLVSARLFRANCEGADFSNADMSQSNPWEVNFTRSNLANVNLEEANMPLADFTEADLSQANLQGSNLKGSKFIRTSIGGANFYGSMVIGATIDQPVYGAYMNMFPENRLYLTVLPDNVAVAFLGSVNDLFDVPSYTDTIDTEEIDWEKYTSPVHKNYHDWHRDWKKQKWKNQNSAN